MRTLDRSFPSPEENLACDEALLDMCEEGYREDILRIWESPTIFVVLGYTNSAGREVDRQACLSVGVPILRRCSGGGTVVQGPGCLNYALVLHIERDPLLRDITGTNLYILQRHADALCSLTRHAIEVQGDTDLTIDGRKFSGNSQRRKGNVLLFHGTFLYGYSLDAVERFLPHPSAEPSYRQHRPHNAFLTNLPVDGKALKASLLQTWDSHEALSEIPDARITRLVEDKYSQSDWTFRR